MSTLSPAPARIDGGWLLRFGLRLDAAASGALGVLGLAAAPLRTELLGPPTGLLRALGGFLAGYAAALLLIAGRPVIPRPAGTVAAR
jgi:hypothetical protein